MQMGKEYTIATFIKEYKEEPISFDTLHFKEVFKKNNNESLIVLSDSILLKYDNELREHMVTLRLSDTEFNKFQYNPKFLSYELYDTTELWFLLLHANELYYTGQFNINPIKVYTSNIVMIIDRILNLEQDFIDINKDEVRKALL